MMIDWSNAIEVAVIGFSGVFAALLFSEICVNFISMGIRAFELIRPSKK